MSRKKVWLWSGYNALGKLVGELEGTDEAHALEEFKHEYPDDIVVKVMRLKGSGRPNIIPAPMPGTARYLVRYIGHDGKRHKCKVRTVSEDRAKVLLGHKGRVTSVKVVGA